MIVYRSLYTFNFNKMKRRLLSMLVFIVLFLGMYFYLNKVFTPYNVNINVLEDFKKISKKTNLDILMFGSSHCYTTFNPLIISNVTKESSYNLGSPSLNISLTDMLLEESLKYTSPKLIILDVFDGTLKKITSEADKGYQLDALDRVSNFSLSKLQGIIDLYEPSEYASAMFPILRNHSKWNEQNFTNLSRRVPEVSANFFLSYGYRGHYKVMDNEDEKMRLEDFNTKVPNRDPSVKLISETAKKHLTDFVKLARNKNIDVLIVSAPEIRAPYGNYSFYDELNSFCKSINVDYLNFNDHYEAMDLTLNDFMDNQHLNLNGGTKASKFFADYLIKEYDILNSEETILFKDFKDNYSNFEDIYKIGKTEVYMQTIQNALTNDIFVEKAEIIRKNRSHKLTIKLDTLNYNINNLDKYNLSLSIIPDAAEMGYVNEKSKIKGWNFDKFDFNLNQEDGEITVDFSTKIKNIKRIELFLYNRAGYTGVIGNKIIISSIIFEELVLK